MGGVGGEGEVGEEVRGGMGCFMGKERIWEGGRGEGTGAGLVVKECGWEVWIREIGAVAYMFLLRAEWHDSQLLEASYGELKSGSFLLAAYKVETSREAGDMTLFIFLG